MTTRGDVSSTEGLMSAWQLRDYGGVESLELVKDLPIPKIISSKDVLIEVKAASVNVLDAWMPGKVKNTEIVWTQAYNFLIFGIRWIW